MTLGCLMSFMVEISRLICRKKQQQRERVKKIINWPGPDWDDKADRPNQTATHTFQRKAGETTTKRDARGRPSATVKARRRPY
jgi:hypothetical protein